MSESTEIVVVIDMSGSMESVRDDTIGGFNAFVEDQKRIPGDARLTVVFFNANIYSKWLDGINLQECPRLTRNEYAPMSGTPLLDSVGRTIRGVADRTGIRDDNSVEEQHRFVELPDDGTEENATRDQRVVFAIITDGHENTSREYTKSQIADMVRDQESKGWQFLFFGANIDSFAESGSIGIQAVNTRNYVSDQVGTMRMYASLSDDVASYRVDRNR